MNRKIRTVSATVIVAFAVAPMLNATIASASSDPADIDATKAEFVNSSAPLTSDQMTATDWSPAGCKGETAYAHFTTKWGSDQASVHGRTKCNARVGEISVTTNLEKLGWLWWDVMATDTSTQYGRDFSEDAHPHWECKGWGDQTYRGTSTHYSIEGVTTYQATSVGQEQRFGC